MDRLARVIAVASWLGATALPAQTYEVVSRFARPEGFPSGRLLATADGSIDGTMTSAGEFGLGSVFALRPDGSGGFVYEELHAFSGPDGVYPSSGVILGANGRLYGTTGSSGDFGTVFELDVRGHLTTLHRLAAADGASPNEPTLGSDGNLYGTTRFGTPGNGTIFRLGLDGTFATLHVFGFGEGSFPIAGLVEGPDGRFYGTTPTGGSQDKGTVFAIDSVGNFATLHDFTGIEGSKPSGALALGPDGLLYGTTSGGGSANWGTVFRMTTAGELTTVYTFLGLADGAAPFGALAVGAGGTLYGSTVAISQNPPLPYIPATSFRIDSAGVFATIHTFVCCIDADPAGPFAQAPDGHLYAVSGGSASGFYGEVFRLELPGGAFHPVYAPPNVQTPLQPSTGLIETPDGIYGLARTGFGAAQTAIFQFDGSGGASLLYAFPQFSSPNRLMHASDGNFYLTQTGDLGSDHGSVVKVDPGGAFSLVHQFTGSEGRIPVGLSEGPPSELWGITLEGGANDLGTVYRIDGSGTYETKHGFSADEGQPVNSSSLVLGLDGKHYGAVGGDPVYFGSIYRMDSLGGFSRVYGATSADDPNGSSPEGVIQASDGNFYGTAFGGGALGHGTLFRIDGSDAISPLYSFADDRETPIGVIEGSDGNLYGAHFGTGSGFPVDWGRIVRSDLTGGFATIQTFGEFDDSLRQPNSPLLQASNGAIYGTAAGGGYPGSRGFGGVFRLLSTAEPPVLASITPSSGHASGGAATALRGHHFRDATISFGGVISPAYFIARESLVTALAPPLPAGALYDITAVEFPSGAETTFPGAWLADFLDVEGDHPFHDYVETIFRNGITAGCGGGSFCPASPVTRAQMAVFLLKAEHGSSYAPPSCQGVFSDVACPSLFADWIEQLAAEGITGGCGGGNYCPTNPVRRDQMAVFLLKGEHGSSYVPPACAGMFPDVSCPSQFADWIEQLAAEQITGGCGGGNYCPGSANTRGQMAVFLVKTFGLQ